MANDAMYNVYATMKKKKAGRPVLMLDAHLDECGFMVQSILEKMCIRDSRSAGDEPGAGAGCAEAADVRRVSGL